MDGEEILDTFYSTVTYEREGDGGWRTPFDAERMRGVKPAHRPDRRRHRRGRASRPATRSPPRQAKKLAEKGVKALLVADEDLYGRYLADDMVNTADRRDLRRGRRRARREAAEGADVEAGFDEIADPRHRPRQHRRLHPQHARGRQERDPRGRAVRHLPRHASGRAADASRPPRRCSSRCSSTASATTSPRSAASR